jgi:hypothetical protein
MKMPYRAERKSHVLSPEAYPPSKVAIHSSGSSDNYQQLNVVPTQIVQSADL